MDIKIEEKEEKYNCRFDQIKKSEECNIVMLGIEDINVLYKCIGIWHLRQRMYDNHYWFRQHSIQTIEDMITLHTVGPLYHTLYASRSPTGNPVKFYIINSFLTESIYNHESIKYENMDDIKSKHVVDHMRDYMPGSYMPFTKHIIKQKSAEMKHNEDQLTLRMQHLLAADAFMIFYDVRYQSELIKVKEYLDEIFELKGYNEIKKKLIKNGLALFPISLIGINNEIVEEKKEMITTSQVSQIAMEYNVDHERMSIHLKEGEYGLRPSGRQKYDRDDGTKILDSFMSFAKMVLDYHYYQSLTDQQIEDLVTRARSDCVIL